LGTHFAAPTIVVKKGGHTRMTRLLRYQVFLGYGAVFAGVWYSALTRRSAWELSSELDSLLRWTPLIAVFLVGLYLACRVAYGVATFESHPEAAAELEQQVKEAKAEMKKRGIVKE
jgi:Dolichol-phosphate mannosyltransferase subunit 3 (DPM3)